MTQKRKLTRILLITIGIIGVLVISLVSLFNYTPNTSALFPYIPPPEGPDYAYIEVTADQLISATIAGYVPVSPEQFKGKSFIFKNVLITEEMVSRMTETYIMHSILRFVAQDPSDLKKLRAGDVVDIIGVCTGEFRGGSFLVAIGNCQFLPAGLVALPLPGGPALIFGGY